MIILEIVAVALWLLACILTAFALSYIAEDYPVAPDQEKDHVRDQRNGDRPDPP